MASAARTVTKNQAKAPRLPRPEIISVLVTKAKTPMGAKRMTHMVMAIITSWMPVQKFCSVSAAAPFMRAMK